MGAAGDMKGAVFFADVIAFYSTDSEEVVTLHKIFHQTG